MKTKEKTNHSSQTKSREEIQVHKEKSNLINHGETLCSDGVISRLPLNKTANPLRRKTQKEKLLIMKGKINPDIEKAFKFGVEERRQEARKEYNKLDTRIKATFEIIMERLDTIEQKIKELSEEKK